MQSNLKQKEVTIPLVIVVYCLFVNASALLHKLLGHPAAQWHVVGGLG